MLKYPEGESVYRIVGIDPGTNTLGVSLLEIDLIRHTVSLQEARTFVGEQLVRRYHYPAIVEWHGDRKARLQAHEDNLYDYFCSVEPHSIIAESPFMGRFAQAYGALVECLVSIRNAVHRYDPLMQLQVIDPPSVKLGVGSTYSRKSTKEDVKIALSKLAQLENPHRYDFLALDEHSSDATAVAWFRAQEMMGMM